jgi:coenzyme F420-reducing hydrogenase alpha subunit
MTTFTLSLNEIAKIEGKASVTISVNEGQITQCQFAITEYKRFYTKAIVGADILGLPQLTARICGTCSNAHILCTIKAVEKALDLIPSEQTRKLRELVNYGLNIRDHALHLYVFCLPDLFGIDNILELNEADPVQKQILEDTFQVKACGNLISKVIGGRSVHAPNLMVGGFLKLPNQTELAPLIETLQKTRPAVLRLIELYCKDETRLDRDIQFAAFLDEHYSFLSGKLMISDGEVLEEHQFADQLKHVEIPYSHASGYTFNDKIYMTGALARLNLGKQWLHPDTIRDATTALAMFPSRNIHHNNLAQAIEILHCIDQSLSILSNLQIQAERPIPPVRKAASGKAVIEAPRGALYYKLDIDETGKVTHGDIIVPTGQNQIGVEQSLRDFLNANLDKETAWLEKEIERIVRAYDPCMSCASHFLKIRWQGNRD